MKIWHLPKGNFKPSWRMLQKCLLLTFVSVCFISCSTSSALNRGVFTFTLKEHGKRAKYGLFIPSKPSSRLLVWLGPNTGDSDVKRAASIVDKNAYVLTAEYIDRRLPRLAVKNGEIDIVIDALAFTIASVLERYPNIRPSESVIAGYSSGSHALMSALEAGNETFLQFGTFVVHEGGISNEAKGCCLDDVHGKILFSVGKESSGKERWLEKYERAKRCKLDVTLMTHEGIQHEMPDEVDAKIYKWLKSRWQISK